MPDARGQAVLSAIIKEHLRTGEPVGSRTISERFAGGAGWSSATIRHVMGELGEAGLVEQPHTPGRPRPQGSVLRGSLVGRALRGRLSALTALGSRAGGERSAQPLMERGSPSFRSCGKSALVSPPMPQRLEHIEFLQLGRRILPSRSPRTVQNKIIRIDEPLGHEELERAARYLNAEFSGKNLQTIRSEILSMMREEKALYDELLRHAVLLFERSLEGDESETGDVYVAGASDILA